MSAAAVVGAVQTRIVSRNWTFGGQTRREEKEVRGAARCAAQRGCRRQENHKPVSGPLPVLSCRSHR